MKNIPIFISTALFMASGALALDVPAKSDFDARIKTVEYNPHEVVRVVSYTGIATTIVFDESEKIIDYVSGFADAWDFLPRDNYLYLKAKLPNADSNLFVRTNKRLYAFELVLQETALPKPSYNEHIAFVVNFDYPQDRAKAKAEKIEKNAIQGLKDQIPVPRNWRYTMHIGENSQEIAPTMAYDDGRFTYFKFPNNRDFPTVYYVNQHGDESMVNSHISTVEHDVLVVHRVGKEFVLRLDNSVVGVYNESFDMDGVPTRTGVTVRGLERKVR